MAVQDTAAEASEDSAALAVMEVAVQDTVAEAIAGLVAEATTEAAATAVGSEAALVARVALAD